MARRVTLRDVAAAAGVGTSTASRVLRDERLDEFRPQTRLAVLEAAAALGYRPNPSARGLRLRRHGAVALIVPDFDNFGFTQITRGAQEALAERDCTLLVAEAGAYATIGDLVGRVDGVLVAFATLDRAAGLTAGLPAESDELPIVLVQRGAPGVASVVMAEERNGALMAEHLLSLGHTRIAHVSGDLDTETGQRRLAGLAEALAAAGRQLDSTLLADGRFSREGGYHAATELMTIARPPTALAVANLLSALGVLAALADLGLRAPDDVSVVTIDEHLVARHTDPPLTTVRTPQRLLGRAAAAALLDVIDGHPVGRIQIDAPAELVVRRSTAPPH